MAVPYLGLAFTGFSSCPPPSSPHTSPPSRVKTVPQSPRNTTSRATDERQSRGSQSCPPVPTAQRDSTTRSDQQHLLSLSVDGSTRKSRVFRVVGRPAAFHSPSLFRLPPSHPASTLFVLIDSATQSPALVAALHEHTELNMFARDLDVCLLRILIKMQCSF